MKTRNNKRRGIGKGAVLRQQNFKIKNIKKKRKENPEISFKKKENWKKRNIREEEVNHCD